MEENVLRQLVWLDYRLAVIFAVILPLIILVWSFRKKSEAVGKLLTIYWRVASLLMITVYLMIPGWSIGFVTGLSARILIPISLWFWVDINEEIRDLPASSFKLFTTSWRWAVSIYSVLGAILSSLFLNCAGNSDLIKTYSCQVWLEPPQIYKTIFHNNSSAGFLGFLAMLGLVFYLLYFGSFLLFRLVKQGRSALEQ